MAWENTLLTDGSRTALENLSSAKCQFMLVRTTSATGFKRQTTAGGVVYGVLQDTPTSGTQGNIMLLGVTKVRVNSTAHAAIAVFDKLMAGAAAGALPQSTSPGVRVGTYIIGRALDTLSSNSTGVITCFLSREGAGSSGAAASA